jgi:hypothetical protein
MMINDEGAIYLGVVNTDEFDYDEDESSVIDEPDDDELEGLL